MGYKWATERKDALWAHTNGDKTQKPPGAPTSARQPTDSMVPISSGTPDQYNYGAYDDEVDPTDQLLREFRTNTTANDQGFFNTSRGCC